MTELSKKINEEHNLQRLNHFTIAHPELKLNKKMMDIADISDRAELLKEIDISKMSKEKTQESISFQFSKPSDYLSRIKEYIPKEIISDENYQEIQNVANYFNNDITSFFGFETNLSSNISKSDYCLAISKNKERDELQNLLNSKEFPTELINKTSWKNITNFTAEWAKPDSIINKNVLGLWFEFDTSESSEGLPEPNIFFHTKSIRIDSKQDENNFNWILKLAMPLLIGRNLSSSIEEKLLDTIKKLPEGASIFHFGMMLSRESNGIRIVINKMKPDNVIPYLDSIGWHYESKQFIQILKELNDYVSRIVLHLNITEEIDKKIGIECSFSLNSYHTESNWEYFLDYLEKNNLCIPEKKKALLEFIGADLESSLPDFNVEQYKPSVMIAESNKSLALVRYISHIKLVFNPGKPIFAKAYPGVRLLGSST